MTVEQSLRALGADDDGQVPPHVDQAVMAAWEKWDRPVGVSSTNDSRPHLFAAAAVLLVLAATLVWQTRRPAIETNPVARQPMTPEIAGVASAPAVQDVARPAATLPLAIPRGTAVPSDAPRTAPAHAGLVLVPEVGAGGPLTLMRVRMARREFSRLGVPITNPDGDGLVDVEVLVGEDGVARSIRRAVAVGWVEPNP